MSRRIHAAADGESTGCGLRYDTIDGGRIDFDVDIDQVITDSHRYHEITCDMCRRFVSWTP